MLDGTQKTNYKWHITCEKQFLVVLDSDRTHTELADIAKSKYPLVNIWNVTRDLIADHMADKYIKIIYQLAVSHVLT